MRQVFALECPQLVIAQEECEFHVALGARIARLRGFFIALVRISGGRSPYAYLREVLERLPTMPASRIGELLPHRWQPSSSG